VFRVAGAYLVVGWVVMQVVEVMAPALNLPEWVDGLMALLLIAGFPVSLVLAWAFDVTPEGVKRTGPADAEIPVRGFGAADGAILAALLVVAGLISYQLLTGEPRNAAAPAITGAGLERPAVIAVLPFTNVSGDPGQDHVSDGIAIDIVGHLENLRVFPVISPNSTFAYKGRSPNIVEVGRELGADYVVEGTVRRAGEALRVTAQLSDAHTGYSLWSETYDRAFSDLFALQDDITRSVVASVAPEIQQSEIGKTRIQTTDDMDAYELYLKGLRPSRTEDFEAAMRAWQNLLAAVERDPDFAPAWVELAWIEHDQITYYASHTTLERQTEARDRALEYARRAVKLDPLLGEARTALGHMLLHFQRIEDANRELARAVELNPSSAWIQSYLGWGQIAAGNYEAGLAAIEMGLRLNPNDPRGWEYVSYQAWGYWWQGDAERALERANEALRMYPDNPYMMMSLVGIHRALGDEAAARASAKELRERFPEWTMTTFHLTSFPPERIEQFIEDLEAAGWEDPRGPLRP
jgi:TolB-like protein/Tfp pilus assembly protein PilF